MLLNSISFVFDGHFVAVGWKCSIASRSWSHEAVTRGALHIPGDDSKLKKGNVSPVYAVGQPKLHFVVS
jgi:hypothetical protein